MENDNSQLFKEDATYYLNPLNINDGYNTNNQNSPAESQHSTRDTDAWITKGLGLLESGNYNEAIKAFDTSIKIDSHNFNAWFHKGFTLSKLNKHEEAIKAYDKAIEINPQDPNAWTNKADALVRLGNSKEAIKACYKALEIDPRNSLAWNNNGYALYKLGKLDDAIKAFDKALEINPNNSLAQNNKENALKSIGKLDKSLHSDDKTIETNPQNSKDSVDKENALDDLNNNQIIRYKPNINLYSERTQVGLGEYILCRLSAVNLIKNPIVHAQVIIIPPSGMSVSSSEFVDSGAGQYTANLTLEPGVGNILK